MDSSINEKININFQTERWYYFKIVRPGVYDNILFFGFEKLDDGRYWITDLNRIETDQDFCYYIKANGAGNPCFINVKFN